jgi:hypothetical protein
MHLASAHFSALKASACDPIPSSFLVIAWFLWYAINPALVPSSVLDPSV